MTILKDISNIKGRIQQIKSLVRAEMEVEDILDDEASEEAEVSDKDDFRNQKISFEEI